MKVVYGNTDRAGSNIARILHDSFSVDAIATPEHPVYLNYPERTAGAAKDEIIIIPSRHRSEKNVRSLTVHAAGNFETNDLGGFKNKMAPYDARVARSILVNLSKYGKGMDYQITYEATHHGPFSENPLIFVEIGSTEKEYEDREAAYIVARSIHEALDENMEIYCAIGGVHYSGKFTRIALENEVAIGHIASKYRFNELSGEILEEMIKKTPGSKGFLIEEKSFNSAQKSKIERTLDGLGLDYRFI